MPQDLLKIYDGRTSFWQYDTGQKLIVLDRTVDQVHFSNKSMNNAWVKEVYIDDDGVRVCDVPDAILKAPKSLMAYAYVMEDDHNKTICGMKFSVATRPVPEDYTYEENNRFKDLVDKIESVEDTLENGESVKRFGSLSEAEAWAKEYEAVGIILSAWNGYEWAVYMVGEDHSLEQVGYTDQIIIDIEKLQRLVGEESVEEQIRNALIALDLDDTYEKKGAAEEVRNELIDEVNRAQNEEAAITRELHKIWDAVDDVEDSVVFEQARAEGAEKALEDRINEVQASIGDAAFVSYNEQALTAEQKEQARTNILAMPNFKLEPLPTITLEPYSNVYDVVDVRTVHIGQKYSALLNSKDILFVAIADDGTMKAITVLNENNTPHLKDIIKISKASDGTKIYITIGNKVWAVDVTNTATSTDITYTLSSNYEYLATYNTAEYTPTRDYAPATKKYVDDTLANSSAVLYTEQTLTPEQKAQARDNIDAIDADYLYYKQPPIYRIDNSNATTLKIYINIMDLDNGGYYYFNTDKQVPENTAIVHMLYYIVACDDGSEFTVWSRAGAAGFQLGNPIKAIVKPGGINQAGNIVASISVLEETNAIYQVFTTPGGISTSSDLTSKIINNGYYLSTQSNYEYTPTKDYNPATKKYVDDAVKTKISTINGIAPDKNGNVQIEVGSGGGSVDIATDDEIIDMLITLDVLAAVSDSDGSILAENGEILLW